MLYLFRENKIRKGREVMNVTTQEVLQNQLLMNCMMNHHPINQNLFSLFEDMRLIEADEVISPLGEPSTWTNYQPIFTSISDDKQGHFTIFAAHQFVNGGTTPDFTQPVLVEYTYVQHATICRQTYLAILKDTLNLA